MSVRFSEFSEIGSVSIEMWGGVELEVIYDYDPELGHAPIEVWVGSTVDIYPVLKDSQIEEIRAAVEREMEE